jgi:hypothetical protein
MSDELLNEIQAAELCGLHDEYFRNLRRSGHGPPYVKPSERVILYRKGNLEAWIASWPTKPTTEDPTSQRAVGVSDVGGIDTTMNERI